MALKDALLVDYDHEVARTRRLLERVPDGALAWKPHVKSSSLGELASHLCGILRFAPVVLNDTGFDLAANPPAPAVASATRADILAEFDALTASARRGLDKTDGEYLALWTLRRGDQEMFVAPKVSAFRNFILHHIIHHRGQLSVYLRLNDVPLPPIYGPSTDDV